MATRREFLARTGAAAGAAMLPVLDPGAAEAVLPLLSNWRHEGADDAAQDEAFWETIRRAFHQSPAFVNMENGYLSPQPESTLRALEEKIRAVNAGPSYYMRREWATERERVTRELASLAGCASEELVVTRNTTESLNTVIGGLDLRAGDEAVMSDQDYPNMLEAFRQIGRRRGVTCVEISLPLHPRGDDEVVEAYARAITRRTKVILVTHMIHLTGQILPARKICDMAHARGVEVILDAAHSFAHIVFTLPETGCDYCGASLHKWLSTPVGAGLLYIRRDKIATVWPLFGETAVAVDDIRKFERVGTQPAWTTAMIPEAIAFHRAVGGARKEARLRHLQNSWTAKAARIPGVTLNTPGGSRSCAIANVAVRGIGAAALADRLFERHRIFTVAIESSAVQGVRVTPHLYTRMEDLDALVAALADIAGAGGKK